MFIMPSVANAGTGMDRFSKILTSLKRFKEEHNLALDDVTLFDGAIRIYNSMLINPQHRGSNQSADSPMTERQRLLLEKLNYSGSMKLTKQEAGEIIQKYLEDKREASSL